MKAIKRTVAALLATLMLATSTSFTLAAENYTDDEAVVVAKVNAAGIMTGTDKGFEPSKSLTRAEAAAIIVRMKGISESAVKTAAGTTLFNDVAASHWASGYVNQASNLGIVKGVSATEFAPDREVTIAEFTTMAIRALGAGQLVDSEGTWPTNYINFANEQKILDNVNAIYTATATRLQAATIVANTLEAVMWEKSGVKTNGEITWEKSKTKDTILDDVLNISKMSEFEVTKVNYADRKITYTFGEKDESNQLITFTKPVADAFDLATVKLGYLYDGFYDEDEKEILGIWESKEMEATSVEFDEIIKYANDEATLSVNGEDEKYDVVATGLVVYYNGKKAANADKFDKNENIFGTAVLNDDDEIAIVYLEEYTNAGVVKEVTDTRVKFDSLDGSYYAGASTFDLDDEDATYFVTKDGKEIDVEDIAKDDVVFYYTDLSDANVMHVLVMNDSEEGKVTVQGSNYIKLDGTKYFVASNGTGEGKFNASVLSVDKEVKVFLNKANKVVAYKEIKGNGTWAVVSSLEFVQNKKAEIEAEIVLTYADGTSSDVLTVNKDSDSDFWPVYKLVTGATSSTSIADLNTGAKAATSILGDVVDYSIDDDEVELKSNTKIKAAMTDVDFVAGKSQKYFVSAENGKVYTNNTTKVLVVKKDDKKDYKVKVSVVDIEDLNSTKTGTANTSDDLTVTFVDVDSKTSIAKLAVIDEVAGHKASKGTSTGKWAIVTGISTKTSKDADYKYEISVITSENEEELYYSDSTIAVDSYGELELNGEEITALPTDDYTYAAAAANYVAKEENGILYLANDAAVENTFAGTLVMSEDVVYILKDGDDYSISSAKAFDKLDVKYDSQTGKDKYDATGASTIVKVLTYAEEEGAPEVVAIVFSK